MMDERITVKSRWLSSHAAYRIRPASAPITRPDDR